MPDKADKKSKKENPQKEKGLWLSRRDFFTLTGIGAFLTTIAVSALSTVRFFFPKALYEPPSTFKAGFPDKYPVGIVNEEWKDEQRTCIIRNAEGFYALSYKCTHLGCTINWLNSENKFYCPCHGSGFYKNGVNFEGPAPRPLERFKITLAEDGQILVDKSKIFRQEKGEWDNLEAFLKV